MFGPLHDIVGEFKNQAHFEPECDVYCNHGIAANSILSVEKVRQQFPNISATRSISSPSKWESHSNSEREAHSSVSPKKVSIDVAHGSGAVSRFQPVLATWHIRSQNRQLYLLPFSICMSRETREREKPRRAFERRDPSPVGSRKPRSVLRDCAGRSTTSVLLAVGCELASCTSGWCAYTHVCPVSAVPHESAQHPRVDSSSPSP